MDERKKREAYRELFLFLLQGLPPRYRRCAGFTATGEFAFRQETWETKSPVGFAFQPA